jgi:hypothetical protein
MKDIKWRARYPFCPVCKVALPAEATRRSHFECLNCGAVLQPRQVNREQPNLRNQCEEKKQQEQESASVNRIREKPFVATAHLLCFTGRDLSVVEGNYIRNYLAIVVFFPMS